MTVSWKSPILRACLYLTWLKTLWEQFYPRAFVKNNQWQYFNITAGWNGDASWNKYEADQNHLKWKSGKWDVQRALWKVLIHSWKSGRSCAHVQLWPWPRKTWKALMSPAWLTWGSVKRGSEGKGTVLAVNSQSIEDVPLTHSQRVRDFLGHLRISLFTH